jgi:hypothetical protein
MRSSPTRARDRRSTGLDRRRLQLGRAHRSAMALACVPGGRLGIHLSAQHPAAARRPGRRAISAGRWSTRRRRPAPRSTSRETRSPTLFISQAIASAAPFTVQGTSAHQPRRRATVAQQATARRGGARGTSVRGDDSKRVSGVCREAQPGVPRAIAPSAQGGGGNDPVEVDVATRQDDSDPGRRAGACAAATATAADGSMSCFV